MLNKDVPIEGNIHDIYSLTPTQEGILFHELNSPSSGLYVEQMIYHLRGELHVSAFKEAWRQVQSRHSILRTAFYWEEISDPMQMVFNDCKLDWKEVNWIDLDEIEVEENLVSYLKEDQLKGFDLELPPLMRFTLIRTLEKNYKFVWSFHHLLLDGWSAYLVMQEVMTIYTALLHNQEPQLLQPKQFKDYVQWLQKQDMSKIESYWDNLLQGFEEPTRLEIGKVEEEMKLKPIEYKEKEVRLSKETFYKLSTLSKKNNLTMNSILQGVWAILLSTYSRKKDIVFGTVFSGRSGNVSEFEDMVGMLINTLPVRLQLEDKDSFVSLVSKLQKQLLELRDFEYSPLVNIQKRHNGQLNDSLFESIFVYENYPMELDKNGEIAEGLFLKSADFKDNTNFPLSIVAFQEECIRLKALYHSSRFNDKDIYNLLVLFKHLIEQICEDENRLILEYELVTAIDKSKILNDFNNTLVEYPKSKSIPELFEEQVRQNPNNKALIVDDISFTYEQINNWANHLCNKLLQNGLVKNERVGLLTGRSIETIVSMLGVLKAGGVYVPLDQEYPINRLNFMLEDCEIKILLKGKDEINNLDFGGKIIDLEKPHVVFQNDLLTLYENEPIKTDYSDLCYVMYTSGSTGNPKGVQVQQNNVLRLVKNQNFADFNEDTKFLMSSTIVFDASTLEIWAPLLNGGQLIVASKEQILDIAKLNTLIKDNKINTMFLSTALFHQISQQDSNIFNAINTLIIGGDILYTNHVNEVISKNPSITIVNGYGPTENTTFSTTYSITAKHDGTIPIGKPINNTKAYVVDENHRLLPIGAIGELLVSGSGVAKGYVKQEGLTREKFIENPFSSGELSYKTGDLVRQKEDGVIEYIGRIDDQIKIRGNRVELSEISYWICQFKGVENAFVTVTKNKAGAKEICAYYVSSALISEDLIKGFLEKNIPSFMIPNYFINLEQLPLNLNGKVDRKALPEPEIKQSEKHEYKGPVTPIEKVLVGIWKEVLNHEQIGINDNFFEVGGDSILAIRVIAKAKEQGVDFSPKDIFEQRTIANLATVVQQIEIQKQEQGMVEGEVPLLPIQHWFFEQELAHPNHFNQTLFLKAKKKVDVVNLEKAVQFLVEYHDALRLRFSKKEENWVQINHGLTENLYDFATIDLSKEPEIQRISEMERRAAVAQHKLNIENGPLVNVIHFNLGEEESDRVLIIIHHLAVDGVSWRILIEDLQVVYQQLLNKEKVVLPSKTTSLKKWSENLVEYAQSKAMQNEEVYWGNVQKAETVQLPLDFEGENFVSSSNTLSAQLSLEETENLIKEVPKAYHTQVHEILLTALKETFNEWLGDASLLIDMEGHGREPIHEALDTSRTVGWFTSIYPIHFDLSTLPSLGESIKSVKEQIRNIPNNGMGYGIYRYLKKKAQAENKAEVSFNYLGQFDESLTVGPHFELSHESVGVEKSEVEKRQYIIEVSGKIIDRTLQIDWNYSENLHDTATIKKLMGNYMEKLRRVIEHCLKPNTGGYTPSDFPLADLEQAELEDLIKTLQ